MPATAEESRNSETKHNREISPGDALLGFPYGVPYGASPYGIQYAVVQPICTEN